MTTMSHEERSYIHRAHSSQYSWQGEGWLSLKLFLRGQAHYCTQDGHYHLDPTTCLILNQSQWYRIEIDSVVATDAFCLFFAPDESRRAYRALTTSFAAGLDDPTGQMPIPAFIERTYPVTSDLLRLVVQDEQRLDTLLREEHIHQVLNMMLASHHQVQREIAALPAQRATTRIEMYRRAWLAHDFLAASFQQDIGLEHVARQVALSPNHLLRAFQQVFHQSPHQFKTQCRLERAAHELTTTAIPVTHICADLGFASLGSFSTLFRRHFGVAPSVYRQEKQVGFKKSVS